MLTALRQEMESGKSASAFIPSYCLNRSVYLQMGFHKSGVYTAHNRQRESTPPIPAELPPSNQPKKFGMFQRRIK